MKKLIYLLPLLLVAVTVSGCVVQDGVNETTTTVNDTIGGERDQYGCLVAAGYSYDQEVGACVRSWELSESQKDNAVVAVAYLNRSELTVTNVNAVDGRTAVEIQDANQEKTVVIVEDSEVTDSGAEMYCTQEEKESDACAQIYDPVCGDNGQTYSNRCMACISGEVDYVLEGEC